MIAQPGGDGGIPMTVNEPDLLRQEPFVHMFPDTKKRVEEVLQIAENIEICSSLWIGRVSIICNQYNIFEWRMWLAGKEATKTNTFIVYGAVPSYTPVWHVTMTRDGDDADWTIVTE